MAENITPEAEGVVAELHGRQFFALLGLGLLMLGIAFFFTVIGMAEMPPISAILVLILMIVPSTILGLWIFIETLRRHPRKISLTATQLNIQYPFQLFQIPLSDIKELRYQLRTSINNGRQQDMSTLHLSTANRGQHRLVQHYLQHPLYKLLPHLPLQTTWETAVETIPPTHFSKGSRREFADYLTGESSVPIHSLDQLCQWLQGCSYSADIDHFGERDVWTHPLDFERGKAGDCEDHALWAWRKLLEMDIPACFVVGLHRNERDETVAHAWVYLTRDERPLVLETTAKRQLLLPLDQVVKRYFPKYGVTAGLETVRFTIEMHPFREAGRAEGRAT